MEYLSKWTCQVCNFKATNIWKTMHQVSSAILNIEGFPKVTISNEIYTNNGNSFPNSIKLRSPLYSSVLSSTTPIDNLLFQPSSMTDAFLTDSFPYKATGILRVQNSAYLEFTAVNMQNNWIFD